MKQMSSMLGSECANTLMKFKHVRLENMKHGIMLNRENRFEDSASCYDGVIEDEKFEYVLSSDVEEDNPENAARNGSWPTSYLSENERSLLNEGALFDNKNSSLLQDENKVISTWMKFTRDGNASSTEALGSTSNCTTLDDLSRNLITNCPTKGLSSTKLLASTTSQSFADKCISPPSYSASQSVRSKMTCPITCYSNQPPRYCSTEFISLPWLLPEATRVSPAVLVIDSRKVPPYPHLINSFVRKNEGIAEIFSKMYGIDCGTFPLYDDYKRDFSSPLNALKNFELSLASRRKRLREHFFCDRHQVLHPDIDVPFKEYFVNSRKCYDLKELGASLLPYHSYYTEEFSKLDFKDENIAKRRKQKETLRNEVAKISFRVKDINNAATSWACQRTIIEGIRKCLGDLRRLEDEISHERYISGNLVSNLSCSYYSHGKTGEPGTSYCSESFKKYENNCTDGLNLDFNGKDESIQERYTISSNLGNKNPVGSSTSYDKRKMSRKISQWAVTADPCVPQPGRGSINGNTKSASTLETLQGIEINGCSADQVLPTNYFRNGMTSGAHDPLQFIACPSYNPSVTQRMKHGGANFDVVPRIPWNGEAAINTERNN